QDVVHVDRVGEQRLYPDRLAAIDAAAIGRLLGVEVFPELEQQPVVAVIGLAEFAELVRPAFGGAGIARDLGGLVALLLLAGLGVARQFDGDRVGLAVTAGQRVQDAAELVEPDMHGGVGDPALAHVIGIVRFLAAGGNAAAQHLLVFRQLGETAHGVPHRRITAPSAVD